MTLPPLFTFIFGTTASGKSALAYQLTKKWHGNVLSYDSRHVYKYMDIVPGKDKPGADFSQVLYGQDLVLPDQDFSIRHYYEYARSIITDHRQRQQPLILVGGSWLYAQVLLDPPSSLFIPQDLMLRQRLSSLDVHDLQIILRDTDQPSFERLNASDKKNPRRLVRAIEVALAASTFPKPKPLIQSDEYTLQITPYSLAKIEKNIKTRIEQRLELGALDETRFLRKSYPHWNTPAFSATGYGPLRQYLEKEISLSEAKRLWLIQERDYAKRQITWIHHLQGDATQGESRAQ